MIAGLLKTDDVERFCVRFFEMGDGEPLGLADLFRDACLYASANLYPDKYTGPYYFVPHSLMGLIAAWETSRYLEEKDQWRPVLQGLWHMGSETRHWGLVDRAPQIIRTAEAVVGAPGEALARAAESRDPGEFFSVFAACQRSPELRTLSTAFLLNACLKDHTNIGHKYIYAVKAAQLIESTRWEEPAIFYPPVHFLFGAPEDHQIYDTARTRFETHRGRLVSRQDRKGTVTDLRVSQLRNAILRDSDDAPRLVIELLALGCSVEAVLDALLLVASHIVRYAPDTDVESWWLYPVHGNNFARSVKYGLPCLQADERVVTLLGLALYLGKIAKSTGAMREGLPGENAAPPVSGTEHLAEAVVAGDARSALQQAAQLAGSRATLPPLIRTLVLLTARKEKFLFCHSIKYLGYLLPAPRPSRRLTEHLLAFVKFLTSTPEESQVMRIAESVAIRLRT